MSWSKSGIVIGVLTALTLPAAAADMPELPPPAYQPPAFISFASGWYVRGDLGYAWGTMGGAQSPAGLPDPTENRLGNNAVGGIGAGIKTRWLRTDITVDYTAPLKYEGTVVTPGDVSAKVSAITALFNGYLDLGTWYGATPYIGAGVGAAQVRVSDYASTAGPAFSASGTHSQWKLAYAAMAGIGYAIAPNILLDLGYRYVNFGNVSTAGNAFGELTLKNLAAHEVRVGFRWSFDDLPPIR